jgi:hypothetical protein
VNDFTVPAVSIAQGRRQEPCSIPNHLHASNKCLRFPGAVLLRSTIQNDTQQKSFLGCSNDAGRRIVSRKFFSRPLERRSKHPRIGTPRCILVDVHEYRTILLGGGMVAGYAAKEFVEGGLKAGELGIVSADSAPPYERPPLSKGLSLREREQRNRSSRQAGSEPRRQGIPFPEPGSGDWRVRERWRYLMHTATACSIYVH